MKILNVNMTIDPVTGGGTAERTVQMTRALARTGMDCAIYTTDLGLTPERLETLNGIKLFVSPCWNERFYIPKISFNEIKDIVDKTDIIHLSNHWTLQNALIYYFARLLSKPYVVCAAGALTIYGRSKGLKKLYNMIIGNRIIRNAAACIAITRDEVHLFRQYGVDDEKIFVIPNGITSDSLVTKDDKKFREKFKLSEDSIILFMGRLNSIKGPDLLLRAFCNLKDSLPNYQLVFAGPDEGMQSELKGMAADHGMGSRVHFIGYIEGIDKSHAYHAADLLVIPSRKEAMSIVALEAGITGTPVLLTDQCGFDDIGRVGGGVVVQATVDGIQIGLVKMLQDTDSLLTMGMKLKEHVAANFTWDTMIERYLVLYNKILSLGSTFH